MFKIKKQKAVSPLIATILLVAVSLSLAGILYSWASQNAGDTVSNVTETSAKWEKCNGVRLDIEQNCVYDTATGIRFILYDNSTIDLDGNITLSVIDSNNQIKTSTFAPNFQGRSMSINISEVSGLTEPIQLVKVYLNLCPDRMAQTRSCN